MANSYLRRILDISKLADERSLFLFGPRQTVRLWHHILVDTLLGFELPPYRTTVKRKSVETAKFYLFDVGVVRSLRRLPRVVPESADFGEFFKHFIFLELLWSDSILARG